MSIPPILKVSTRVDLSRKKPFLIDVVDSAVYSNVPFPLLSQLCDWVQRERKEYFGGQGESTIGQLSVWTISN